MKILFAFGIGLLLLVLLTGCSRPENAIVGKWQSTEKYPTTLEFFKDGTVSTSDSNSSLSGRYTFPDVTHIQMSNGVVSDVKTFKIEGDTLTLTGEMYGKPATEELHRVKE